MIQTRITFNGSKVRLGPGIGFKKYQMLTLGQYALDTIKARVTKGIGSDDAPMKPLTERYRTFKELIGLAADSGSARSWQDHLHGSDLRQGCGAAFWRQGQGLEEWPGQSFCV
jgi:hypothetical protein